MYSWVKLDPIVRFDFAIDMASSTISTFSTVLSILCLFLLFQAAPAAAFGAGNIGIDQLTNLCLPVLISSSFHLQD